MLLDRTASKEAGSESRGGGEGGRSANTEGLRARPRSGAGRARGKWAPRPRPR